MEDETWTLKGKMGLRGHLIPPLPPSGISEAPCGSRGVLSHGLSPPLGCVSLRTRCFDTPYYVKGQPRRKLVPTPPPPPFIAQSRKWATITPLSQLCLLFFC